MTKTNDQKGRGKKKPTDLPEDNGNQDPGFPDVEVYRVARAGQIWSYSDTGHDLTIEEQLFVRSYIIDRQDIAALKRLNYAQDLPQLKRIAKAFLANPEVQGVIEFLARRMMEQLDITAERVQRRIAAVAFFDPRQVVQFDDAGVAMLNSRYWTEEQAANIQSVEMGQHGLKVKFYDGLKAAEMLAKQLQLQPEEDTAAAAAAAKAGAEAVFDKIMDLFDKTVEPDTPVPEITYKDAVDGNLH